MCRDNSPLVGIFALPKTRRQSSVSNSAGDAARTLARGLFTRNIRNILIAGDSISGFIR
jgi:hypothetical protein